MTKQQQTWLNEYVEHGNARLALETAGYKPCSDASARQLVYQLRRDLSQEIIDATMKRISSQVPMARQIIEQLAIDETAPHLVRLNACKDILSRAGLDAASRVEDVTKQDKRTDEQIQASIIEQVKASPAMARAVEAALSKPALKVVNSKV